MHVAFFYFNRLSAKRSKCAPVQKSDNASVREGGNSPLFFYACVHCYCVVIGKLRQKSEETRDHIIEKCAISLLGMRDGMRQAHLCHLSIFSREIRNTRCT